MRAVAYMLSWPVHMGYEDSERCESDHEPTSEDESDLQQRELTAVGWRRVGNRLVRGLQRLLLELASVARASASLGGIHTPCVNERSEWDRVRRRR